MTTTTLTTPSLPGDEPVRAVIEPPPERGNAFVAIVLFIIVAAAIFFIIVFVIERITVDIEQAGVEGIRAFIAEKSAALRTARPFTCVSNIRFS